MTNTEFCSQIEEQFIKTNNLNKYCILNNKGIIYLIPNDIALDSKYQAQVVVIKDNVICIPDKLTKKLIFVLSSLLLLLPTLYFKVSLKDKPLTWISGLAKEEYMNLLNNI